MEMKNVKGSYDYNIEEERVRSFIKNTLTNKQKVFIEKYIKMVNDLEESKITNFPFLCTLFTVRVDNTSEIELYANEYVEFSWWKMKCLYPGYFFNIKYCAPSEIISSVSLP